MTRKYVPVWRQVDHSAGDRDGQRAGREIVLGLIVLFLWVVAGWMWASILSAGAA